MIKVDGRELKISQSERKIGFEGDNLYEKRQFLITDEKLFDFTFKLDTQDNDIIELNKTYSSELGGIVLEWNISCTSLNSVGNYCVQLRAFDQAGVVWHSEKASFYVGKAINAQNEMQESTISEFAQIEQNVANLCAQMDEKVQSASQSASLSQEALETFNQRAQQREASLSDKADTVYVDEKSSTLNDSIIRLQESTQEKFNQTNDEISKTEKVENKISDLINYGVVIDPDEIKYPTAYAVQNFVSARVDNNTDVEKTYNKRKSIDYSMQTDNTTYPSTAAVLGFVSNEVVGVAVESSNQISQVNDKITALQTDVETSFSEVENQITSLQTDVETNLSELENHIDEFQKDTEESFTEVENQILGINEKLETVGVWQNVSNALKGTAKGEIVRVDDVSTVEHTAKVKVTSKNILNADNIESLSAGNITIDGGTVKIPAATSVYGIRMDASILELNEVYTFSITDITDHESTWGWRLAYQDGTFSSISYNNTMTLLIQKPIKAIQFYLGMPYTGNQDVYITDIQIEKGTTATEYTPYVDPTTATVTRCGKNLLGFSQSFTKSIGGITVEYDNETQTFTFNGTYSGEQTILLDAYMDVKPKIATGSITTTTVEKISGSISNEDSYNVFYLSCSDSPGGTRTNWYALKLPTEKNTSTSVAKNDYLNSVWFYIARDVTFTDYKIRIQFEVCDISTQYEPYNSQTYTLDADGTLDIAYASPTMTVFTDTTGVNIDLEYNKDINKAFAQLQNAIISLGGNV